MIQMQFVQTIQERILVLVTTDTVEMEQAVLVRGENVILR